LWTWERPGTIFPIIVVGRTARRDVNPMLPVTKGGGTVTAGCEELCEAEPVSLVLAQVLRDVDSGIPAGRPLAQRTPVRRDAMEE